MSSDWLPRGFDEISSEELERSMEHEVEGLMELDDLDLGSGASEQITPDLLRNAGAGSPGAQSRSASRAPDRRSQRRR